MSVQTKIIKIQPHVIEREHIEAAAKVLKKEGVIVYPTDTFYGLGASCYSRAAIHRIRRLKKRDPQKPLSIVVSSSDMLQSVVTDLPPLFMALSSKFWPGPLTLVLSASTRLPRELLSSKETIGVRLPAHPWLLELVKSLDSPITATSANLSGEKEIISPENAVDIFSGKVDLIVDGGTAQEKLPSTVVDLTLERPKILRKGAVSEEVLIKYMNGLD
jgi:L-threonylcarbamoyladenylate synthase